MSKMKKSRGFTLIELVISLSILGIAIFGIYGAFSNVSVLTTTVHSRLVAAYLAQEGLEIVRNIRDNNWIWGYGWDQGLINCESGCQIDYKTGTSSGGSVMGWGGGNFLMIDDNGFYSYNSCVGCEETKFKRKITIISKKDIEEGEYDNILDVTVDVYWQEKREEFSYQAKEYFYDWF